MRKELIIGAWDRWIENPREINELEKIIKEEPKNFNANLLLGRHYVGLVNQRLEGALENKLGNEEVKTSQESSATASQEPNTTASQEASIKLSQDTIDYARKAIENFIIAESSLNSASRSNADEKLEKATATTSDEILSTISYLYRLLGKYRTALPFMEKLYAERGRDNKTLDLIVDTVAKDFRTAVDVSDSSTYWISKYYKVNMKIAEYFEHIKKRVAVVYVDKTLDSLEKSKTYFEKITKDADKEEERYLKTIAGFDILITRAAEVYRRMIFSFNDEVVMLLRGQEKLEEYNPKDRTSDIPLRKIEIQDVLTDKLERIKKYSEGNDHETMLRILNIRYMKGEYGTVQEMANEALQDKTLTPNIAAKVEFIKMVSYFADDKIDSAVECTIDYFQRLEDLNNAEQLFVKGIKALGYMVIGKVRKARWELLGTPWLKKSYKPEMREYRRLRNMLYRRGK